ncbi:hypothetical protein BZM27_48405 [Paraburkholderia steynii]|uniref:Uncharacterized protein n=1 Tax=Paraburkholderia steynii TaxID=1245441 RepID=A0A4V2NG41_9BURK|nr:hypothetical protein BZM27_48405 [Paraburkholderia steynii]
MKKRRISPEEFISKVNAELPRMPGYVHGMCVFLYPDGVDAAYASGYDVHPKSALTRGVVGYAASQVLFYFDVNPQISRVP